MSESCPKCGSNRTKFEGQTSWECGSYQSLIGGSHIKTPAFKLIESEHCQCRTALAAATKESERWSKLYSNLQDERAADFAKWFKMLDYGGLTEYQAECPQVIDDAIRQLVNWRWTTRMGLVVQAMASECAGKPDWAVIDVDGDVLGFGKTPMEAIESAKKEVEGE